MNTAKLLVVIDIHDLVADTPRLVTSAADLVETYGGTAPKDNRSFWGAIEVINHISPASMMFVISSDKFVDYMNDCNNKREMEFTSIMAQNLSYDYGQKQNLISCVARLDATQSLLSDFVLMIDLPEENQNG